jgi:hypothetical protein
MSTLSANSPVHVFLEQSVEAGTRPESSRLPFARAETCLRNHDIHLLENFRSRSGQQVISHFLAADAESVRHVARRYRHGLNTLWLTSNGEQGETPDGAWQPIYAAIYNKRAGRDSELRRQVFVSDDSGRLLVFCALAECAAEADESYAIAPELPR